MRALIFLVVLNLCSLGRAQQDVLPPAKNGAATTVQLPTFGISFDADGVLELKTFSDPTGALTQQRLAAARVRLAHPVAQASRLRKVSLVRLEKALRARLDARQEPTEEMSKLAGLLQVEAIYCYPDRGDVVLVGPAEGWMEDLSGRTVGMRTRRPTLLLEDLAVALRAYPPGSKQRGFVGCTINPRPEGLARLRQVQQQIPRTIPVAQRGPVTAEIARRVQASLGMAEVQVFGVSERTHFARVMIEADYRMKRIAIGVEPAPVPMTTFAAALTSARHGVLQRWWFTPAYDCAQASPDRLAMKLVGQGVQLQTEDKAILPSGMLQQAATKPGKATLAYANSFTRQYEQIAAVRPCYAQLRQLADLLIVAAFMRKHDWYGQANWNADLLLDERQYVLERLENPVDAPVVVNAFWKRNRMFTPAGGGVSIEAELALASETLRNAEELQELRENLPQAEGAQSWWWD